MTDCHSQFPSCILVIIVLSALYVIILFLSANGKQCHSQRRHVFLQQLCILKNAKGVRKVWPGIFEKVPSY